MNKQAMQTALNELQKTIEQLQDAGAGEDVIDQLEHAAVALELELQKANKKWYVFDKHDCFGSFNSVAEAAQCAESMESDAAEGIHILHLTIEQSNAYASKGIAALKGVISEG